MSDRDASDRDASDHADEAATMMDGHPNADALLAYAEDPADSPPSSRVGRHIAGCARCRNLVDDLQDYPALDAPDARFEVDEQEIRAGLASLRVAHLARQAQASEETEPAEPVRAAASTTVPSNAPPTTLSPLTAAPPTASPQTAAPPAAPRRGRSGAWLAWAASIVLAVGWALHGAREARRLATEVSSLEQQLATVRADVQEPRPNVRILQLHTASNPLRSSAIPDGSLADRETLLLFQNEEPWLDGTYTCEIRGQGGTVVKRIDGLLRQVPGMTLRLPPAVLAPGTYEIRLVHDATGSETPFELFVLQ